MSTTPYLLPAFYEDGGAAVPVEGSSQAILFSLLGAQVARDGVTSTTFSLTPDPVTGGLLVSHGKTRIGRLPRNLRQTYPQLDHLLNRGATPEVNARIALTPGSGTLSGELYFPAPVFVMPTNVPPTGEWALLPEGELRDIDVTAGDAQRLIDLNIPSQWLVTLTVVDDAVVAIADDRVFGPLSAYDSADIRGIVDHYEMLGLVPVARAFCYDSDGQRRVIISAASTTRMDESALEPTISPLPALDPYQPATGEFPMIVSSHTPNTWAVTVSGEELAEPLHTPIGGPLKAISSPSSPSTESAHSDSLLDAPFGTGSWPASPTTGWATAVRNPEPAPLPAVESVARHAAPDPEPEPEPTPEPVVEAEPIAPATPYSSYEDYSAAQQPRHGAAPYWQPEAPAAQQPAAAEYDQPSYEQQGYGHAAYEQQGYSQPSYEQQGGAHHYEPATYEAPSYEASSYAQSYAAQPEVQAPEPAPAAPQPEPQAEEPQQDAYYSQFTDDKVDDAYPPLPYPNARLGSHFAEAPAPAAPADDFETAMIPRVPDPEPAPVTGSHRKVSGASASRVSKDGGSMDGMSWLAALGVIAGALAVTVATLGYFKITDDLSLGTSTALILLGSGILLVLGSLWFMFRPRD
ncbi:hypothetical protein ACUY3K_02425 [Corynebacterium uberis]|uniref:hypothetical protein n=1 Tax=Corynebacterium TaxID=1716 RepID=UPI001D0BCFB5|nr:MULTISPECIES: hypothetical protein [Corynebacterium]MCZ9309912.1 hypothetical protein [Corynebacterium sp. c6VSa_13]UDL73168.1 hypothetical protein LH391_08630 [Corynebacterium uberis]UDL75955.1 hypothetical protein LH393_00760 [Corynebacterium uberis]UDL78167.1 hypothetical protein LH394_00755 [Corynebacterium uberis]UDL80450.1 hypothetical protein LH392_01185 [Corynebacterium uberis]